MSIFEYASAIRINFDKEIVTEIGSIYSMLVQSLGTIICTSESRPASYAFDDSTGSKWEPSSSYPQHIGKNFGSTKSIGKIRVYIGAEYRPNGYKIRGSTNGSTWVDIASGNFANTTGWQEAVFTPASYQYWCLQILSAYNTYTWIYELQFYEAIPSLPVDCWTVTGQEYDRIPGGSLVNKTYTVRRVTKSEDGLSITLWLNRSNRMLFPQGQVTVGYSKTIGNLQGAFGSVIEDFSISFTPHDITPIFYPNSEHSLSLSIATTAGLVSVTYTNGYQDARIELSIATIGSLIHIDDLEE